MERRRSLVSGTLLPSADEWRRRAAWDMETHRLQAHGGRPIEPVMPIQIVILLGTPGCGKTWAGEVLSRKVGLAFLDLERMLLARYGSTENFLARKPKALAWFEDQVRDRAAERDRTVIFEAGAFSQRDTIRTTVSLLLAATFDSFHL